MPAVLDLYALLKRLLDARLAGGRAPLQASGGAGARAAGRRPGGIHSVLLCLLVCIEAAASLHAATRRPLIATAAPAPLPAAVHLLRVVGGGSSSSAALMGHQPLCMRACEQPPHAAALTADPASHRRLSVKPANPPADDPQCLTCYRAPSAAALALARFVDYAVRQDDVWFITHSDLVRRSI